MSKYSFTGTQLIQNEQDTGTHTWSEAVRITDEFMKQFGVEGFDYE